MATRAPLDLAWRALNPLGYANYKSIWEESGGSYDRREFWEILRNAAMANDCELRFMQHDDPGATWIPVTRGYLEALDVGMLESTEIDPENSTITFPDGKTNSIRVFLVKESDRRDTGSPVSAEGDAKRKTQSDIPKKSARERVIGTAKLMKAKGQGVTPRNVWEALGAPSRNPTLDYVTKVVKETDLR